MMRFKMRLDLFVVLLVTTLLYSIPGSSGDEEFDLDAFLDRYGNLEDLDSAKLDDLLEQYDISGLSELYEMNDAIFGRDDDSTSDSKSYSDEFKSDPLGHLLNKLFPSDFPDGSSWVDDLMERLSSQNEHLDGSWTDLFEDLPSGSSWLDKVPWELWAPDWDGSSLIADIFPEPGYLLPGVSIIDALDAVGKALNASTIRASIEELCTVHDAFTTEFQNILPGYLLSGISELGTYICAHKGESAPLDDLQGTCESTIVDSLGYWSIGKEINHIKDQINLPSEFNDSRVNSRRKRLASDMYSDSYLFYNDDEFDYYGLLGFTKAFEYGFDMDIFDGESVCYTTADLISSDSDTIRDHAYTLVIELLHWAMYYTENSCKTFQDNYDDISPSSDSASSPRRSSSDPSPYDYDSYGNYSNEESLSSNSSSSSQSTFDESSPSSGNLSYFDSSSDNISYYIEYEYELFPNFTSDYLVEGLLAILADIPDFEELCVTMNNIAVERDDNDNFKYFDDFMFNATDKLLKTILEDVDECIKAFERIDSIEPDIFGFQTDTFTASEMCSVIVGFFDTNSNHDVYIDADDLMSISSTSSDQMGWVSKALYPLHLLDVLKVIGRVFNQDNPYDAFDVLCENIPFDDQDDEISDMCSALYNNDLFSYNLYLKNCVKAFYRDLGYDSEYDSNFYNDSYINEYYSDSSYTKDEDDRDNDISERWDDSSSDVWSDDPSEVWEYYSSYYDSESIDHHWIELVNIRRYIDEIFQNGVEEFEPFSICRVINEDLNVGTDGIAENLIRPAVRSMMRTLIKNVQNDFCSPIDNIDYFPSSDYWLTEEYRDRLFLTMAEIVKSLSWYSSSSGVCYDLKRYKPKSSDFEFFLDYVTDSFMSIPNDTNICLQFTSAIARNQDIGHYFYNFTGFSTPRDICWFIKEASQGNVNLKNITNTMNFSISSSADEESSSSSTSSSSSEFYKHVYYGKLPDKPGWLTSFADLKTLIAVYYGALGSDTVVEGMGIVCGNLAEPVAKTVGKDLASEIKELCDAVATSAVSPQDGILDSCENLFVPLINGPNYPQGLRPFPTEDLIDKVFELLGMSVDLADSSYGSDMYDICPAVANIINGDTNLMDFIYTIGEEIFVYLTDEWLLGMCNQQEEIFDLFTTSNVDDKDEDDWHWDTKGYREEFKPENVTVSTNSSKQGLNSSSSADDTYDYFSSSSFSSNVPDIDIVMLSDLIGLLSGTGSVEAGCSRLVEEHEQHNLSQFFTELMENFMAMFTEVAKCEKFFELSNSWWSTQESQDTMLYLLYHTGFSDVDELCETLVYHITQEEIEECFGIVDCNGVCNGDARSDCTGKCNGITEVDCMGDCDGDAFINNCGECVGGNTRRPNDFGADKCGNCRKATGYLEAWDCAGTCYGNATYDKCWECVGGESGRPLDDNDDRLDCRSKCDGGWEADSCNFCEPQSDIEYALGSKYKDCTGECIKPGFPRAFLNDCDLCVGGDSGTEENAGKNVCDVCVNDTSVDQLYCVGCDGIPKSGVELDACGDCGGTGTNCVGVGRVHPNIIPDELVEIIIDGAGFTEGSVLKCVYIRHSDGLQVDGEMITWNSNQEMSCAADLEAGLYNVSVQRDSGQVSTIVAPLRVFENIQIASFTPNELTINRTLVGTTVEIIATASEANAFAVIGSLDPDEWDVDPVLFLYTEDGDTWRIPGEFLSNSEILYMLTYPADSGRLSARPTVNGISNLSLAEDPTYLTAYFQSPSAIEAKFTPEGAGIMVTFDLGVNYENFMSCEDVFASTELLGEGALCKWRSPKDLYIVIGKGDSLIEIDGTLAFKSNAIYAFRQDYGHPSTGGVTVSGPDVAIKPTAIISGYALLPSCGNVELNGRRSIGGGGRPMTFEWSVDVFTGDVTNITSELELLQAENDGFGSALVQLDGDLLQSNRSYTFTLTVYNFLGGNDSTSFAVERSESATPEVKIFAKGVDPDNVKVADSFTLTAEVKFYSECVPAGETQFEWSVSSDDVGLNLKTQYSRTLFVEANSLPGGETIEFTVKVYKSENPNAFVTRSIYVTTVKSELVAIIKGGQEFTVGRSSGEVVIDGSLTYDPDEEARPWVYSFECTQTTDNSACWSYNPDRLGQLITNETNINDAVLTFDALAFEADKTYEITLIVTKEERSASTSVIISAVNGNPPKIEMAELQDDGKVKDSDVIFLTAYVYTESEMAEVTWTTVDTEDGYGFIDLTDANNLVLEPMYLDPGSGFLIAMVGIKGGVAERGTSYAFLVTATTIDDQSGTAKAYIIVRSGPTSCEFSINDYEELSTTLVLTENCVTEADAQPLSFQLFTENSEGKIEAVSEQNSEPEFSIVGIPSDGENGTRKYIIKVCNRFDICSEYSSTAVVTEKTSFTTEEKQEYKSNQVNEPKFKGDYQKALGNLGLLADIENNENAASKRRRRSRTRRAAAATTGQTAGGQLELIELTLTETVLTKSSAQLLIDNTASLELSDVSLEDHGKLLDYYLEMIAVFEEAEETVPDSSSDLILEKVSEISSGLDPVHNTNTLDKCKDVQEKLLGSISSELVLGAGVTEVVDNDVTLGIQKTLLDGTFESKSTGTNVGINFGAELSGMFGAAWSCSSGSACTGVNLKISHYNTAIDLFSQTQDDKDNRAADIIEIILADPDSDTQLNVTGLTTPVELAFPLTRSGSSNVDYFCVTWDNDAWTSAGISTTILDATNIQCATTHLSVFTVLAIPIPTTAAPDLDEEIVVTTTEEVEVEESEEGGFELGLLYIIIAICAIVLLFVIIILLVCICLKMGKSKHATQSPEPCAERGERCEMQVHQSAVGGGNSYGTGTQPGYSQPPKLQPLPGYNNYDMQPPPKYDQLGYDNPNHIPDAPAYKPPPSVGGSSHVPPSKSSKTGEEPNVYSDYVNTVAGGQMRKGNNSRSMTPVD